MVNATRVIDKLLVTPASISAAGTASGTYDISGASWVSIRIPLAARVNTSAVAPTVSVLTSDVDTASVYATVTADRSESLANAHELRYEIDNKTGKKYLKVAITAATHTTNDLVTHGGVIVSLTRNKLDPASTTAMQASTNDAVVLAST